MGFSVFGVGVIGAVAHQDFIGRERTPNPQLALKNLPCMGNGHCSGPKKPNARPLRLGPVRQSRRTLPTGLVFDWHRKVRYASGSARNRYWGMAVMIIYLVLKRYH